MSRARPGSAALVLALVLGAGGAPAQDATLEAGVDRETVRANESFSYSLRAEGQVRGDPDVSPLEREFDVLSRRQNSRIQIINGRTEQVVEWIFQLMPREAGRFTLPPLEVGGLTSNAVDLEVLPARAGSDSAADIFFEVEAEPRTAYVQSQVLFTLKLYLGVSTGRASLSAPKVSGGEAIVEHLGADGQYQSERDGRTYIVRERRYAVFPQASGTLTIGPATFEAMVIPARGFSRVRRIESDQLEIEVEPAVPPPDEYPDAAWLPSAGLSLSERLSDAGEPFTLGVPRTRSITVEADGVLETQLPELELGATEGIRQYPDQPDLDRTTSETGLHAERTERYAVIAQREGEAVLGGVELPWFDVGTGTWKVARIEPRTLDVLPGAEPANVPPAPPSESGGASDTAASDDTGDAAVARTSGDARFWRAVSAALAAGWLATLLAYAARRRVRAFLSARRASARERGEPRARRRLKQLRAACRAHDAAEARRLLLEWAAVELDDAPPATLGALAARLPEAFAAEVRGLEAHLYGRAPGRWDGSRLAQLLARERPLRAGAARRGPADPLEPLYR